MTAVATAVAIVVVAAAGVPTINDSKHGLLVVDTLSGAVSLLAALLVFGRFRRSSMVADLALVWAFFTLAAGNLAAAYVEPPHRFKLASGVLGSFAILVAAGAH